MFRTFESLNPAARMLGRSAHAALPVAAISVLLATSGCGSSSESGNVQKPLKVTATTRQMGDLARQIAGNGVTVTTIIPESTDPHGYQPTASDVDSLSRSTLVFRAGGDLDRWLAPSLKNASAAPRIVNLSESVTVLSKPGGGVNAHWHLDASNLALAAAAVRDALIKENPGAADTYRSNATAFINRAKVIHEALKICGGGLSASKKRVITDHDDFDYMAKAYGLKIVARVRRNAARPASPGLIRKAISAGKSGKAKAVFTSWGQIDPGAGQVSLKLNIPKLALFSDTLGPAGQGATTVLDGTALSVQQAVQGLSGSTSSCTIPE